MKKNNYAAILILFLAGLFFSSSPIFSQRLHDEETDKKAQEAAKLAEEISSKSSFENQLKNLDTFSKRDTELYFRGAKRQMDLDILGFRTWRKTSALVENVNGTLNADDFIPSDQTQQINDDLKKDCGQRTTELGKKICEAKAELDKLKAAVKASEERGELLEKELKARLETIDDIDSLIDSAQNFLDTKPVVSTNKETIDGLQTVFVNLSKAYINYTNKLATIQNQPKDELKLLLQRIAVETLQNEADHWKTIGEIKLRRGEEQSELLILVKNYQFRMQQIPVCFNVDPATLGSERLDLTFQRVKDLAKCTIKEDNGAPKELQRDEIIGYLMGTLYIASALAARGETPMKLAELRLAQEEHRYSIRQSAVIARAYELTFTSGTKRLARYYAGGIKPEKLAQLIYSAATVAVPIVIAGK